jgi:hypothetical protein
MYAEPSYPYPRKIANLSFVLITVGEVIDPRDFLPTNAAPVALPLDCCAWNCSSVPTREVTTPDAVIEARTTPEESLASRRFPVCDAVAATVTGIAAAEGEVNVFVLVNALALARIAAPVG